MRCDELERDGTMEGSRWLVISCGSEEVFRVTLVITALCHIDSCLGAPGANGVCRNYWRGYHLGHIFVGFGKQMYHPVGPGAMTHRP